MSRSTPGRTHCKLLDDIATPANGGPSGRSGTPPSATPLGSPTALPRAEWDELGLDTAPFTVQHCAPMSLVHFYFSQLTLNCVFVVERGRFVGMINKQDMHHADVV